LNLVKHSLLNYGRFLISLFLTESYFGERTEENKRYRMWQRKLTVYKLVPT
jgi:hypothetical protein